MKRISRGTPYVLSSTDMEHAGDLDIIDRRSLHTDESVGRVAVAAMRLTEQVQQINERLDDIETEMAKHCIGLRAQRDALDVLTSVVNTAGEVREWQGRQIQPPPPAFSLPVIGCPSCGHGIDPHGSFLGGECGVGDQRGVACLCMWSPNDIAASMLEQVKKARP